MLCSIIMLFVLPENFRQQPWAQAATNTCMQRLLPCLLGHRAAAWTLPTLFPAAQRPSENTLHKPLPVLPVTSSAEKGDAFWGKVQHARSHGLLECPGRPFTTFHFCSSLVEQGGRERTVCLFCLPTKRYLKPSKHRLGYSTAYLPCQVRVTQGPDQNQDRTT